jgi:hypothetical protein
MREGMLGVRIGELPDRCGVSARSLRYYEQQGLVTPSRPTNGYREHDELTAAKVRSASADGGTRMVSLGRQRVVEAGLYTRVAPDVRTSARAVFSGF